MMFDNIDKDNWLKYLKEINLTDENVINYLKNNEEKILDLLLVNPVNNSLNDKRVEYIKFVLSKSIYKFEKNQDVAIQKILEICEQLNYSILMFGKRLNGSTLIVYEFGDKIIKFGRYFPIYKENFITLQIKVPTSS